MLPFYPYYYDTVDVIRKKLFIKGDQEFWVTKNERHLAVARKSQHSSQLALENRAGEIDSVVIGADKSQLFPLRGFPHCSTRYNFVTSSPFAAASTSTIVLSLLWQTQKKGNHSISPMWWSEVNMREARAPLVIIIINFATMFTQWNIRISSFEGNSSASPRSIQFSRVAQRLSPNLHMTTIWQRLEKSLLLPLLACKT